MDLVRALSDDPDNRHQTLKDIRALLISSSLLLTCDLKKLISALKLCLAPQQSNVCLPILNNYFSIAFQDASRSDPIRGLENY